MKRRKTPGSKWGVHLYFEDREFEVMMDELRSRAGGKCFDEHRGVDVGLVLKNALKIIPEYADLPLNVLGETGALPDGKTYIRISRDLKEDAKYDSTARRRLRTTLAHECGHATCHPELYAADASALSLFPSENNIKNRHRILCRQNAIDRPADGYSGEWWEYQANRCMAALLLPKKLFSSRLESLIRDEGLASFEEVIVADKAKQIVRELVDVFDVSKQATLFRIQALGYLPDVSQRELALTDP